MSNDQELKLGRYQHFKGKFYRVIGIARHSETNEEFVVYQALYDSEEFGNNALWIRPKSMFLEKINQDGKEFQRFKFVGENIILATASPYRIERFKELGLDFTSQASNINEYHEGRPTEPQELVKYLAKLKAQEVSKNYSDGIIIGFDSVAYFEGKIIEKPKSRQEAFERIKNFSGKTHEFFTGIHMINLTNKKILTDIVKTEVLFWDLSDEEINKYLDTDSRVITYSLGYDPLGHKSFSFVKSIKGSYNNLLCGLPVEKIVEMLKEIGYDNC